VHAPCEDKSDDIKDSFYEELGRVLDQFPRYDMKMFLGDFNAKVGREDTLKPTIGNESSHEISNDNGVKVIHFATPKNLDVKSSVFSHRSVHKYNWTSPDGKTHNQTDHVLIDRRRHSSILDVGECSLIRDLLCTCTSIQRSETDCVLTLRRFCNEGKIISNFSFYMLLCHTFQ
jgi:hypothetical protein